DKVSGILQMKGNITLGSSYTFIQAFVDVLTEHSTVILRDSTNIITGNAVFDNLELHPSDSMVFYLNLETTGQPFITVKDTQLIAGEHPVWLHGTLIKAEGDIHMTNTAPNGGGDILIELSNSATQNIIGLDTSVAEPEGKGILPAITINKYGGMVRWHGAINIGGKLLWKQGFADASGYSRVYLHETDSLLGGAEAALLDGLQGQTGFMAFHELYLKGNTP